MNGLSRFGTATLHDAAVRLELTGAIDGLAPLLPGSRLSGPAVTVRFGAKKAGAKAMSFYDVITAAAEGSVIVVELGLDRWVAGGNITAFAQRHRLGGMLIDACIRDVEEVRASGFPVFSRGPAVSSYSIDMMLVEVGGPVTCRGVRIEPGDHIAADDDGAFAIPSARTAEVLHQAQDIHEIDQAQADGIAAGWPLERLRENMARWPQVRP